MEDRQALPKLAELWTEPEPEDLRCCKCSDSFEQDVLVRTFQIQSREYNNVGADRTCSRYIEAPKFRIALFNRHQRCQNGVRYLAVSHVWDRTVSGAHLQGRHTPLETEARDLIIDSLDRIAAGLHGEIDEGMEIWYDYISVPQWENRFKAQIIRAIPVIFYQAEFTLIHLDDIGGEQLELLRNGETQKDRLAGITGICNAKWFKRVWTVMEYVRSRNIRVMNSHGQLMSGVTDATFLEMYQAWDKEVANAPSVHHVEAVAEMGKNIVPWNLGPLGIGHAAKVLDFGLAFSLLSRRGCASMGDFFEALLGIVKGKIDEPLSTDPEKAIVQIAVSCLKAGDYSPLLMMPRSSGGINRNWYATVYHKDAMASLFERCGYFDVLAFGLGPLSGYPTYHSESVFWPNLRLKLEVIGRVVFAMTDTTCAHSLWCFILLAQTALTFIGPNPKEFIRTIGSRLYNLCDDDIEEILSDEEKCSRVHEILTQWYNKQHSTLFDGERTETGKRLASLLGLDRIHPESHPVVSPIQFMSEHGGTLHNGNSGNLVAVRCPKCNGTYVYRAAIYRAPSEIHGSIAYRLAGVLHQGRLNETLGVLVKDGDIVGRLIWASRACDCRHAEMVDISLRDLPMQEPRDNENI